MTETRMESGCPCSTRMSSLETTDPSCCECSKRKEDPKPIRKKIKSKPDEFNPQPYNFRLQQEGQGPRVRAPPFHVQLDHTIAVLWNLFRQPNNAPDVGHLQWAKHFLQRIRNNHGDMPKDVEAIVKAIQQRILSLYADLSKITAYKAPTCCSTDPEHCQAKQSVTFTEMVKQKPEVVQELFCVENLTLAESCSSHVECDCQTSKDEMAKYLKQQRAERVRIIHAELKRLQELDKLMGNVGESGIDGVDVKALKQIESGRASTSSRADEPSTSSKQTEEPRTSQAGRSVTTIPSGRDIAEGNLIDL
ncbi:uncharacterized protein LOC126354347 [Schistocerca gregaria]|uniref:uncharacterized protein LOC126354347 n=1 Tax=Schistocerca gregaria TaxID=7010 RepID=UPI00211DDDFE|nr:uncharacterized protein LOC126354347 [Schistocerca gregaria]